MELSDSELWINRDWDPVYLSELFTEEFEECTDLWSNDLTDVELLKGVEIMEKYSPIVEDISIEDDVLCSAVARIEEEYV